LLFRYKENAIASILGVTLDTEISYSEWKTIRRRCKLTPRRFSKQFIACELTKRNKYRQMVRTIQNDPNQRLVNFPYNIYKIICAGTMVRAYCKIHQTIQRGTVLSYDQRKAMYLIEFENKALGNEYCPDSDVASCDFPTVLIRKCFYISHDNIEQSIDPLTGTLSVKILYRIPTIRWINLKNLPYQLHFCRFNVKI
jgi:DIRP